MEASKFGIAIRKDNQEIRAFKSAFERSVGEILTIEGRQFKVCGLDENYHYAMGRIGLFRSQLFDFHKF